MKLHREIRRTKDSDEEEKLRAALQVAKDERDELRDTKKALKAEKYLRGHEVEWNVTILQTSDGTIYTTPIPGGAETRERDLHGKEFVISSSGQATREEFRAAGLPDRDIVGKLHSHPISDIENPRADEREQSFSPSDTDIDKARAAKSVLHFMIDPGGGITEYDGNGRLTPIRGEAPQGTNAVDLVRESIGKEAFDARIEAARSVLKANRRALARAQ
jgi:hypothetical protein